MGGASLALAILPPLLAVLLIAGTIWLLKSRREARMWRKIAETDLLTGLPNRRGLETYWNGHPGPKALILIDLVGFKAVNDGHGHIVGDALLRDVAERLAEAVPPPGLVARWGGDEFVAVVPRDRLVQQQAVFKDAGQVRFDLSAHGGPADASIGARIGVSAHEVDFARAIATAARELMNGKAG